MQKQAIHSMRQLSRLRQQVAVLRTELSRLIGILLEGQSMVRGCFYELKRKCGKKDCRCNREGKLHHTPVLSWKNQGRTKLMVIPKGRLVEISVMAGRYRRFRQTRLRLVKLQTEILELVDKIEQGINRDRHYFLNRDI